MKLVGSRGAVRTPQFHKQKERAKIWRYILIVLAGVVLVVAPTIALRSPKLVITDIGVTGNKITETHDIGKIVSENLKGFYLWFVPKTSMVFYPNSKIEENLLNSFPRLASVSLSLKNFNNLKVSVTEREPSALYCAETCFFMDNTGFIFAEAPDFSDGVYLIYKSEPADVDPLGTQFLSTEDFTKLNRFVSGLNHLGFETSKLIKEEGEYLILTKNNTKIRWKSNQDMNSVLADIEAFVKAITPAQAKRLLYIDMRIENRIGYQFQD